MRGSKVAWLLACKVSAFVKYGTAAGILACRKAKSNALKAGYTGHITQMGNRLLAAAEARPMISQHLDAHDHWQGFATSRLAEANEVATSTISSGGRRYQCWISWPFCKGYNEANHLLPYNCTDNEGKGTAQSLLTFVAGRGRGILGVRTAHGAANTWW